MSTPIITDLNKEAGISQEPTNLDSGSSLIPVEACSAQQEGNIKVFNPISESSTPKTEFDESFFEPTLTDVQSHQTSITNRNKKLNEAPLLTSKFRDIEKSEKERLKKDKWPNTTIRIKFSDGTIVQNIFPSSSPIQPVYDFVRTTLSEDVINKPFVLYQPPKTKYPEHPIPSISTSKKSNLGKNPIIPPANYGFVRGSTLQGLQGGTGNKETLNELGLVPQSVLLIKWDDEDMNASTHSAPIKDHLKAQSQPLPPSMPKESQASTPQASESKPGSAPISTGEKKIPKWLQKGLMKKKH
ncbi:uncharacterized protein IL334_005272 [Kwoniella shivajii]|uniref:UBX domain-containing protein n=1 Tax=Kwoniella shivajii TaxID=564305 RepID=A0ABZ1D359_9TREE|nr:hypothetical protein IL334_005272 [Kwoniella shivajii]